MKLFYPAKFIKEDTGYTVDFLDFTCTTQGDSLEDAMEMAKEAMGLYFEDLSTLPTPTLNFNNIKVAKGDFISLVELDMDEYRKCHDNKAIKKTLTIPNWLNVKAESANLNFSKILQEALKKELNINI